MKGTILYVIPDDDYGFRGAIPAEAAAPEKAPSALIRRCIPNANSSVF